MDIIDEYSTIVTSSSATTGDGRSGAEGASSYTPSLRGSPPSTRNWGSESENQTPLVSGYQTPVLRQIAEEDNEKRISAAFASVSAEYWAGRADELMVPTVNEAHTSSTEESANESTPIESAPGGSTDPASTPMTSVVMTFDSGLPPTAHPSPLATHLPVNSTVVENQQVKSQFSLAYARVGGVAVTLFLVLVTYSQLSFDIAFG